MNDKSESMTEAYLKNIARDIQSLKSEMSQVINYMHEAESEVPEKMRRFANYFHDIVHIKGEYVSLGLKAPDHIDREMERCDDRMRHLVDDLNQSGETFEKVRREMTKREGNRWDHKAMLPKGNSDETRTSIQQQDGVDEGGTELSGGEPSIRRIVGD